jgi:hypothetical protein
MSPKREYQKYTSPFLKPYLQRQRQTPCMNMTRASHPYETPQSTQYSDHSSRTQGERIRPDNWIYQPSGGGYVQQKRGLDRWRWKYKSGCGGWDPMDLDLAFRRCVGVLRSWLDWGMY